jgi:hypothetical protein
MNFRGLMFMAMLAAAFAAAPISAQTPDAGIAFGNHLTLANIVSTLQSGGYQALVTQLPVPAAPAANGAAPVAPPPNMLGLITTGINGVKVFLIPTRCPTAKNDEICSINFFAAFTDNRGLVTDANLIALNQKANMVKVLPQKKDNTAFGFSLFYTYVCKDLDDPKLINTVLMSFGADMGLVVNAFNAFATPAPAQAPAK